MPSSPPRRPLHPGAGARAGDDLVGLTAYGCTIEEARCLRAAADAAGIRLTTTDQPLSVANASSAAAGGCVSVGHRSAVSAAELRALRRVGVTHLSTRSVGRDHIDVGEADALGIEVVAVGYDPDGVADFTVMLILMALRHAPATLASAQAHDFRLGERGRDLRALTVGVVGVGRIGRAVVRRLEGFGCRVLASTRQPVAGLDAATVVPFDELLRRSDVVTLHVPWEATTHHLVGAPELARMRPGALLVNTSRGAVVDTSALLAALERGSLGGAALDVVEGEAGTFYRDRRGRELDHPHLARLLERPDVIVTPHCAFHTVRALHDTVDRTLQACRDHERNRAHAHTVRPDPVRRVLRGA